MNRVAAFVFVTLAPALGHSGLEAQLPADLWVGATASAITTRTSDLSGGLAFNGFLLGALGRAAFDNVIVHAGYAQGSLGLRTGDARRQYVEGHLFLGVSPLPALEFMAGPHVRTTIADESLALPGDDDPRRNPDAQRWVLWEIRGRFDAAIYQLQATAGTLRIFVEARAAPFGSVNLPEFFDNARGGETGLELRILEPRINARLSYSIDETRLRERLRRETTENITLAIGFAFGGPRSETVAAMERETSRRP